MMYSENSIDEMDEDLELALKLSLECSQNDARNYESIPHPLPSSSLNTLEARKRPVELNGQNPSPKKVNSEEDEDYLLALKLSEEINQVAPPINNVNDDFALALAENEDYLFALQLQNEEFQTDAIPVGSKMFTTTATQTRPNNSPTSKPAGQSGKRNYSDRSISVVDPSWETTDPVPNIYALFAAFNERFFWGKLGSVKVKWIHRMTQGSNLCGYSVKKGRFYYIQLSQPILEFCPRKNLVETILHEMIHVFLIVTKNYCDLDDQHGPQFCKHMKRINKRSGANITIYQPYEIMRELLEAAPVTTEDGMILRELVVGYGAINAILSCLAVQTHQGTSNSTDSSDQDTQMTGKNGATNHEEKYYWAKGTGYGSGNVNATWNADEALAKKRTEEQHVIILLQILAYYINPDVKIKNCSSAILSKTFDSPLLPIKFVELIEQSCLIPVLASYLRNDSILDMARHVPLYRAIMALLRAMTLDSQIIKFMLPPEYCTQHSSSTRSDPISLLNLLKQMKSCVNAYWSTLIRTQTSLQDFDFEGSSASSYSQTHTESRSYSLPDGSASYTFENAGSSATGYAGNLSTSGNEDPATPNSSKAQEDDEDLNKLILDIQDTTKFVEVIVSNFIFNSRSEAIEQPQKALMAATVSIEEIYIRMMKKLQFASYDIVTENGFDIAYHYKRDVINDRDRIIICPARMKRLGLEASILNKSLPCDYTSSIFVRTDTSRLDVMKALIIGPAGTPYENGCFEFDVYFPPYYPNEPLLINLQTTGRNSVRFNPNLYHYGKVCLSVLNTWQGRPEERWNPRTSNLYQVLLSIQSLIFVSDPYFNEPGYEISRGTTDGNEKSQLYNHNIRVATVQWAMLETIRNPTPCFQEVIETHFYLKRKEIMEELRKFAKANPDQLYENFETLQQEFAKLQPPQGLESEEANRFSL